MAFVYYPDTGIARPSLLVDSFNAVPHAFLSLLIYAWSQLNAEEPSFMNPPPGSFGSNLTYGTGIGMQGVFVRQNKY